MKELKEQVSMLEESNTDLQANMESCGIREMEHLEFTQKISDKNARVQSENITLNSAVGDVRRVGVCSAAPRLARMFSIIILFILFWKVSGLVPR